MIRLRWVILGGLLLRAIFAPLGGELSDDYHRYLWDGALVRGGANPYLQLPIEIVAKEPFSGDEWRDRFESMNSPNYYSIYPPLSQFSFALAGRGGYWGLKLFFALAELGALLLLARLVQARLLILYAWNPLVVLETWGQPHTEALALLFLALALWTWREKKPLMATAAITLAAWVKLFPLLLLPFLWRRMDRRNFIRSMLIAAAISVGLLLPFVSSRAGTHVIESSHLYMLSFEFNAGPYYLLKWVTTGPLRALGWLGENQDTSKVIGPLMRASFLCGLIWLWRFDRNGQRPLAETMMAYIALFLVTFVNLHPWYLTFAMLMTPWMSKAHGLAWLWLGAWSLGTYLSYSHDLYWPFVVVGWIGFAVLLLRDRIRVQRSVT